MKILLGKKIGMTQSFTENGKLVPVTVIDVSKNVVSRHIKNGEQVTHVEIGKDIKKNPRKVELGQYKKIEFVPKFTTRYKIEGNDNSLEEATSLLAEVFSEGDLIDIIGTSKGKGFAGVMKRWNFKGGKRTHGQSDRERAPGSIGSGTTPGRVVKGKKMAGRMGREQKTIKNLKIVDVNTENNTITVSGSVPGYNGAYLIIKESRYNKNNK